jgi:hypothetical protein
MVTVDSFPTALQPSAYWDAPINNSAVYTPNDSYSVQNTQPLYYNDPSLW